MPTLHQRIMRRFVDEILNAGDLSSLPELVHPQYVHRSPGQELRGHAGLSALLNGYRSAFPDLWIEVDELLGLEDGTLLCFTLTGTQRGALLGHPASDRRVKVHGMVRSRFRDDKIAEEWELVDQLGLFEQLGLLRSGA